jgi:hypothetical protein
MGDDPDIVNLWQAWRSAPSSASSNATLGLTSLRLRTPGVAIGEVQSHDGPRAWPLASMLASPGRGRSESRRRAPRSFLRDADLSGAPYPVWPQRTQPGWEPRTRPLPRSARPLRGVPSARVVGARPHSRFLVLELVILAPSMLARPAMARLGNLRR